MRIVLEIVAVYFEEFIAMIIPEISPNTIITAPKIININWLVAKKEGLGVGVGKIIPLSFRSAV